MPLQIDLKLANQGQQLAELERMVCLKHFLCMASSTGQPGPSPQKNRAWSPSVQDVMEIADGKDKEQWGKEMWWEPRCIVWVHTRNLRRSGKPAIGTCGGGVLISVTLPQEANSMIFELWGVTQVPLHSDIIIHQLLVEWSSVTLQGKHPIFCAKWHSAALCTKQEVPEPSSKKEKWWKTTQ